MGDRYSASMFIAVTVCCIAARSSEMRELSEPSLCKDWGNQIPSGPKNSERGGQLRDKGALEQGGLILPSWQPGVRRSPLEGWFSRMGKGWRLGVEEGLWIEG